MRARRRMRYSAVIRGDDVRPMTSTNFGHRAGPAALAGMRGRRRGAPFAPLVVLTVLILGAVGFVAYVLWPRWPGPPVAADAPPLPITVAGVAFKVAPAAMRMPVQRRPGEHERVDLAYLWPSLEPAGASAAPPAGAPSPAAPGRPIWWCASRATGSTTGAWSRAISIACSRCCGRADGGGYACRVSPSRSKSRIGISK